MPNRVEITSVCDEYLAALSSHEPDAIVKVFSETATHEEPIGTPVRVGHDQLRAFFEQNKHMPVTATRLGPVTVVGNRAAFQVRVFVATEDGKRLLTATDLVTVDDQGLILSFVSIPDPHAHPDDEDAQAGQESRAAARDDICRLCDEYLAAASSHDPDAVVKLFAENASQQDPIGTTPNVGREQIQAFFAAVRDIPFTLTRLGPVTVAGNRAAFQARVERDTPEGKVAMTTTDVITVDEEGRIAEILAFPDREARPGRANGASA